MEQDPKISRDPDPPPNGSPRLDIAAPAPLPDVPIAWAETHSCVRRMGSIGSAEELFPDCWPVLFRCPDSCATCILSMPGLPSLAFTRRSACLQFSRSQTSSIHCSVVGFSALRFANSDSVPPTEAIGAAPLLSSAKARRYWFFCRLSVVESRRVLIAPFIPFRGPFGPSLLSQLLRPLLTPAPWSGAISRSSVLNPRPVAGLPR